MNLSSLTGSRAFYGGAVLLALYFCWPMLETGAHLGLYDWDQHLLFYGAVFKSLLEYGQLPFWNPWECGGNVLWQNPQVAILSPAYLFALVVALPFSVKLNVLVHYLVGLFGMHRILTRVVGLAFLPVVFFISALYVFCGAIALHVAEGHTTFLAYLYLPWVAYFFLRGALTPHSAASGPAPPIADAPTTHDALRMALPGAVWAALMIYNGGTLAYLHTFLALGIFALLYAVCAKNVRALVALAEVAVLSALLAAPKLVPVLAFMADERSVDTRTMLDRWSYSPRMLLYSLVNPYQARNSRLVGTGPYGWHEYGNYIGSLGFALITACLLITLVRLAQRRKLDPAMCALACTTLLLLLVSLGRIFPYSPYDLLTRLPPFRSTRISGRVLIVGTFFAALTIAYFIKCYVTPARARMGQEISLLIGLVFAIATLDLAHFNRKHFNRVFVLDPPATAWRLLSGPSVLTWDVRGDPAAPQSPMYRAMLRGEGMVKCYEPFRVRPSIDETQALVYLSDGRAVEGLRFSPNRISFTRPLDAADQRVVFNQNYISGWTDRAGALAFDRDGRKAYGAAGSGRREFSFRPAGLGPGIFLFLLGLASGLLVWRKPRVDARS